LKKLIDLKERQVSFKNIEESIGTTSLTGQFFFHITGEFAELESNLIREHIMAGIVNARVRGKKWWSTKGH
jgi:DNA invertase Pin-like site-specific DNA recombinase